MITTQRLLVFLTLLSVLTLTATLLHSRAHPTQPTSLPNRFDSSPRLSGEEIARIAAALQGALAPSTAPARPSPASTPASTPDGDHPLKQPFQRGIRKLQADIRDRAERALYPSQPPARPPEPPATKPTSPAAWQILSTGTSRNSAPLVERLLTMDGAALTAACSPTTPVDLRFRYRWVRAQYSVDDHGELSASPVKAHPEATCLIDQLTKTQVLGRRNHGSGAWTLEARFHPGQETSP